MGLNLGHGHKLAEKRWGLIAVVVAMAFGATRRAPRTVAVCLRCGVPPETEVADCVHPRVGRVQLTPRITHLLTQLRGARSFARYVATRLEQTVEIEAMAGRAVLEEASTPTQEPRATRRARAREPEAPRMDGRHRAQPEAPEAAAAPVVDARQRPLFADLG